MFQTSTSVLQTIQLAHLVTVQIQLATSRGMSVWLWTDRQQM